jgi:AraC family transcriptional regulator
MKSVYDIIYQIQKEMQRKYAPDAQYEMIMPAIEKISSDFTSNDISVKELATLCNISEVYMRKVFINKFGVSPKEYIIDKRISHAKQLLRSGQFSVSNVALLCGYREPSHFSNEFKKIVGVSPTEYGSGLDL